MEGACLRNRTTGSPAGSRASSAKMDPGAENGLGYYSGAQRAGRLLWRKKLLGLTVTSQMSLGTSGTMGGHDDLQW